MKSLYGEAWDQLALRALGGEFQLDTLITAQVVSDFDSPVYSFTMSTSEDITVPTDTTSTSSYFKAPWE